MNLITLHIIKCYNNKEVYTSYDNNNTWDTSLIRTKITNILNSKNFIYSKLVNIVVGNDTIKRKIIGINGNNLITIDNEYIPLANIIDIYI